MGNMSGRFDLCVACGCANGTRGSQLCREHVRRLNRGEGLPTANELRLEDTSGFGVYGALDINAYGILCSECGRRFIRLGNHLRRTHALDSREYRRRHGVPVGVLLVAVDSRVSEPAASCATSSAPSGSSPDPNATNEASELTRTTVAAVHNKGSRLRASHTRQLAGGAALQKEPDQAE